MPLYAVKIGEIHLVSEEPITEAQRKEVVQRLKGDQSSFEEVSALLENRDAKFVPDKVG